MNRYNDFFKNMNDEEWEKFSFDVLMHCGFKPITSPAYGNDGGKDYLVEFNNLTFLVSCKHYFNSGKHVGQDDEENISDRLAQHGASVFVGFYSTGITSGLQNRLDGICKNNNYKYMIFDPPQIIKLVQKMDTNVLQSYGLFPNKYYMNVSENEYQPLNCVICGKDILKDNNIPYSMTGIAIYKKNGKYTYVYGCKECIGFLTDSLPWMEIEQALHIEMIQKWEKIIEEFIKENNLPLSKDFYKQWHIFNNRVRQRQFPQTDGTWQGL